MSLEKDKLKIEENGNKSVCTEKKKKSNKFVDGTRRIVSTVFKWVSRTFCGASKSVVISGDANADDKFKVEEIISPGKQAVKNYFRRPLAVIALCVVVGMFLLSFVGPLCMPNYSDDYTSTLQINLPPTTSMRRVPSKLKGDVKQISSTSFFTVGLSSSGDVYVWGVKKLPVTNVDIGEIPDEVKKSVITHVAAGKDHVIAVSQEGKVYAWGNSNLGQFASSNEDVLEQEKNDGIIVMPEILRNGTIDSSQIKKVTCGSQASAILMNDGTLYIWGNAKTYSNMKYFTADKFFDVDFTLSNVVGISYDQKNVYTGVGGLFDKLKMNIGEASAEQSLLIGTRKITALATTNSSICVTLDDGKLLFGGSLDSDIVIKNPSIGKGNKFVKVDGGSDHFVGVASNGKVYAWGDNTFGQCDIDSDGNDAFAGAYQSYVLGEEGKLIDSVGLKGYIFGTDGNGADVFKRIISGGKMTLTIGAVAVIISTVIGIIVGCVSGYFGGWVDMLLMRITEIVAAIPFLPFAMILSALLAQTDISENKRIFLIMLILGVLSWTGLARLVRGQVLSARENEYVTAAKAMGVKESKIAFKHILPNVISVIIVTLTLDFAGCMLTESSLSYLGFGVQYPRPTWGNMLNSTTKLTIIGNFWWQWLFPGLFLAITTICINIVGDTIRDVLDPKSSSER